jgi:hypothetical protein
MSNSSILKISIPSLLLLALAFAFWNSEYSIKSSPDHAFIETYSTYPLKISGVDFKSFDDSRLLVRIKADEIKINPRKFLIFNIRKVNELTITNANLEVYLKPDAEDKKPYLLTENNIPESIYPKKNRASDIKLGMVTRGVVKNIAVKMFNDQELLLVIKAPSANIDFKNKEVKLKTVQVEHIPSGKHITASTIYWDEQNECFKIPGKYFVNAPEGNVWGKKVRFDTNFIFSPLT